MSFIAQRATAESDSGPQPLILCVAVSALPTFPLPLPFPPPSPPSLPSLSPSRAYCLDSRRRLPRRNRHMRADAIDTRPSLDGCPGRRLTHVTGRRGYGKEERRLGRLRVRQCEISVSNSQGTGLLFRVNRVSCQLSCYFFSA